MKEIHCIISGTTLNDERTFAILSPEPGLWDRIKSALVAGKLVHIGGLTINGFIAKRLIGHDPYGKRVRIDPNWSIYYEHE